MAQKFKFNILTGENAPDKYAAISPKDPFTFYLLETGQGYLGEKKMFDSVADTIDTINPDAPGAGIPTEAAIVNYVIEAVRNKVPYEIDGVPGGDLSGSSGGTAIVEDSPIGTIISYMGAVAPKDYLVCDGSEYNISQYPDLAAFFENQFGAKNHFGGDGVTKFAVPDLRNLFLRGYHGDATEQLSGEIGAKQEATKIPYVNANNYNVSIPSVESTTDSTSPENTDTIDASENPQWEIKSEKDTTWPVPQHYTARPVNAAVLYCIKAVTSVPAENVYSTEEQVVGRWIDGKPIYRRCFEGVTGALNTEATIISIADIQTVVDSCVFLYRQDINMICPVLIQTSLWHLYWLISNTNLRIAVSHSDFVNKPVKGWIEYTKTTD